MRYRLACPTFDLAYTGVGALNWLSCEDGRRFWDEGIDYVEAGFRLVARIAPRPGDDSATASTFGSWSSLARTLNRDLISDGAG